MKVVKFKECNVTYAQLQREYRNLPCHRTADGIVTSCWSLSFKERFKVLFGGVLFLRVHTFNKLLQPLMMSVDNPVKGGTVADRWGLPVVGNVPDKPVKDDKIEVDTLIGAGSVGQISTGCVKKEDIKGVMSVNADRKNEMDAFYLVKQKHQKINPGGCKIISKGDGCDCFLCQCDRLMEGGNNDVSE